MILLFIAIAAVVLIAKNQQNSATQPISDTGGGISHVYGDKGTHFVTARQPPWGTVESFNFQQTTTPEPTDGGEISAGSTQFGVPVSQLRFPAGIAKLSNAGGGGFQ